jgi:hypothetical protein
MSTGYGKTATGHSATAVKVRASGATVPETVIVFPQKEDSSPLSVNAPVVESIVPVVCSESPMPGQLVEADSAEPACAMKSERAQQQRGGDSG